MNILNILEIFLYTMITTVLPIITTFITKFLTAKKEQISTQIENEKLNIYLKTALEAVNQSVFTVSQTYVDSLKEKGEFDTESQIKAKNKAIETATSIITNDTKNAINQLYGNFDKWLDSAIEKFVNVNK